MSDTLSCPHCGSPVRAAVMTAETGDRGGRGDCGLDSLYREVRRIREIAESREDVAGSRVAELTREVEELRATVARLRGSAMAGPAR